MSKLIINADKPAGTISRHIYGHFAEHLGRCIYDGIWVGEKSHIPNVRGIRTDIVDALKTISIPNLRWPGGCFADTYHWKDGIGPRDERPSMVNVHWGGDTEDNSFGTHEFLDLCVQLGCEPYICGNVGSGTIQEMAEWVEYVSSDADSPMTKLRAEHGRPEPWKVTYWGVGNENWGCGGWMRPEYYADLYRQYACSCRDFGKNRLFKIACGPNGDNYHWTETVMDNMSEAGTGGPANPSQFMQGLALHFYTHPQGQNRSATDFGDVEWFGVLHDALRMKELIERHSTIMDRYDPQETVAMVVDEWGTWYEVEPGTNPRHLYQQNSLRDALAAAITFDVFHKNCRRVKMANIAQTVNVLQSMILTDGDAMLLTPTYHVFEMNRVHHDATLLDYSLTEGVCGPAEWEVPRLSTSVSASKGGQVNLSVSNLDPHRGETLEVEVRGRRVDKAQGRLLTADALNAFNTFNDGEVVMPKPMDGISVSENRILLTVPAKSFSVLSLT